MYSSYPIGYRWMLLSFRKLDAIHVFAREGDVENFPKCMDGGVGADVKGTVPPLGIGGS